jgi:hypothetical protein
VPEQLASAYFSPGDVLPTGELLGVSYEARGDLGQMFVGTLDPTKRSPKRFANAPVQLISMGTLKVTPGRNAFTFLREDGGHVEVWSQSFDGRPALPIRVPLRHRGTEVLPRRQRSH